MNAPFVSPIPVPVQVCEFLTGRRRYRTETATYHPIYGDHIWEGDRQAVLILQVELSKWREGNSRKEGGWYCYWRDARPNEVCLHELASSAPH